MSVLVYAGFFFWKKVLLEGDHRHLSGVPASKCGCQFFRDGEADYLPLMLIMC